MLQERRKMTLLVLLMLYPFFAYGMIRVAPFITNDGISYFIDHLERDLREHPVRIFLTKQTPKVLVIGTFAYILIGAVIYMDLRDGRASQKSIRNMRQKKWYSRRLRSGCRI